MKTLLWCAAVAAVAGAVPAWAQGPVAEARVKMPGTFGVSHGTLVVGEGGVEYKTTDPKNARRWTYQQIKEIHIVSPTRVVLRTYEDRGWTGLWTDRSITFYGEGQPISPSFAATLLAWTPRAVVTAVLPTPTGTPRFEVPVKHVRARRGSEGQLLLYADALVYRSAQPAASRYWRFGDLVSVFLANRFRLELLAYEGGGGDTRPFSFELQSDLPAGFYDTLWSAMNAPPPLRGTDTAVPGQARRPEAR